MSEQDPMWGELKNPPVLERIRRWIGPIMDRLNIAPNHVLPLVAVCFGFRTPDRSGWGGRVSFGTSETRSLYYNGILFVRLMLPFYVGFGLRWRGRGEGKEFMQFGIGWKLNGNIALTLRVQSDSSAAKGTTGPNYGQAIGWMDGTK